MGVTDNPILRQLRTMDGKLDDIRERVGHLETRMTGQERRLSSLLINLAGCFDSGVGDLGRQHAQHLREKLADRFSRATKALVDK